MANMVVQAAEPLVTACGRRIDVGQLKVDGPSVRIGRVTLDVGPETGGTSRIWAGLSPAEARELAQRLLDQAARAEGESSPTAARRVVEVARAGPHGWAATANGRHLLTAGGRAPAPTPVEQLVASAATCAAERAARFLESRGLPHDTLRVTAHYDELDDQPARITSLRLVLALPPGLDPQRHAALREALTRCAVTNTLRHPPKVMVDLL
ncbi:OsmC family protein [Kitasatospora purpeofusca]|uniref:OsmC family protein n=1 Tax=Kitasatospora purpeofusca TaxID=67352 RepID=UPI002253828A|nr:OsmC family protein [Kitasatospora purpeofusca]MCX4757160.1 OsmC family protein [Kitasatospora purpeofusca]WSR35079.1 OsmC family protein [Kitasatospora purpeofusca]WSR43402.1 OsmC family protein [Kitasatospora purpeofusca]